MTFFLENHLSRQYVCNIFQTFLAVALVKAKPERLSSKNFETVPLITLTARKESKLTFFPSSTVQFKSMLFFFSLLLDINFCFELVKVTKNLQQNFEALFRIWKACWTDDFVRSIRQNLAVKTRGRKYIKSRIVN